MKRSCLVCLLSSLVLAGCGSGSAAPGLDGARGGGDATADATASGERGSADARTGGGSLVPMPVISRGVPAFASSNYSSCQDASAANDADYGTTWRSSGTPSTSSPEWLAYDLSGVPAARRAHDVIAWYNENYDYDLSVNGDTAYNLVADYTIDANAGPGGGSPPASGWVTLASVTGNTFHSRQHVVDLTSGGTVYNWVRIHVTAVAGTTYNYDVDLQMDVQDASGGLDDDWIFYGDSITAFYMEHDPEAGSCPSPCSYGMPGEYGQLVAAQKPAFFPVEENGGVGGLHAYDGVTLVPKWLPVFPGHYVALNYGTNDAWNSALCDSSCAATFYGEMESMVKAVLAAGKIPVIPLIPWSSVPQIQMNGPILNAQIQALEKAYPQIVPGPDLWTFTKNNPSLLMDGVHPNPEGRLAIRNLWAKTMAAAVYP